MLVDCAGESIAAKEAKEIPVVFNGRFGSIVAVMLLCFFARPVDCFADKVFLKSGQEEEGRIVEKNQDHVILYVNGVSKVHPISDIERIVAAELPKTIPASKNEGPAGADEPSNGACVSTVSCCNLGSLALSKRESDRAIQLFDDAIRYDPKNANAYQGRGRAHMIKSEKGEDQKMELSEALKDASEAVRLDPSSVTGWLLRATALRKLGRLDESIVDGEKVLTLNPFSEGAYMERGYARNGKGDYEGAISDFSKVIALSNDAVILAWGLSRRASVYVKLGDFVRAEVDCDRAMQMDPACYFTYEVRARIFAARKEYDRAWAAVRKSQELGGSVNPIFLEKLKKDAPPS